MVQPFRFNLDKVLKVRQHQVMLAKHELAGAQVALARAWAALEQARLARSTFEAELEERRKRRMSAQQWAASAQQHDAKALAEKEAAQHLHEALAAVAEKRANLEEAERRCKTLENLRDQEMEAHRYEADREEQNLVDEMAQAMRSSERRAGVS